MLLLILLFITAVLQVHGKAEDKIFGGRNAKKGEFPYLVGMKSDRFCAGILVSMSKFLTLGECFMNEDRSLKRSGEFTVYAGTTVMPFVEGYRDDMARTRKVSEFKVHENYRSDEYNTYDDIAQAVVDEPFIQSDLLSVAPLPSLDEKEFQKAWNYVLSSGQKCLSPGWGTTLYLPHIITGEPSPEQVSADLKVAELMPLSDEACAKMLKYENFDFMKHKSKGEICLESVREGESPCTGDGGGPLVCNGKVFAYFKSHFGCGNKSMPLTYIMFGPYLKYFDVGSSQTIHTYNWAEVLILLNTILKQLST